MSPARRRTLEWQQKQPTGLEAFANVYSDAAEAIAARGSGHMPDPLALWLPNERDGAIGVKFVAASVESSRRCLDRRPTGLRGRW